MSFMDCEQQAISSAEAVCRLSRCRRAQALQHVAVRPATGQARCGEWAVHLDPLVGDGHLQPVVEADAALSHRPADVSQLHSQAGALLNAGCESALLLPS